MIYYRIAWKSNQASLWQWKSTKLTSLEGVFHFIRVHRAIPPHQLRVFSSSSCEGLRDLLEYENQGGQPASITAEQLLRGRDMAAGKVPGGASEQGGSGEREYQERKTITATLPPLESQDRQDAVMAEQPISVLDRRRVEIEMGAGADHDLPYTFTLPLSLPQRLAWTRLMARVQRGELEL